MPETNCNGCIFFHVVFGDRLGVCRRYPTFTNRSEAEWCGEFRGKMIALPVVEMRKETVTFDPPGGEIKKRGPKKGWKNLQTSE